ncbi:hypothetical protein Taro_016816, partial [Colocasia esculenta]|nr:hypothetical protein [Colocasia esculenta]
HLRRQCFEGLRLEFGHVSFVDLGLLQDFDERRSQLFAPCNGVPYGDGFYRLPELVDPSCPWLFIRLFFEQRAQAILLRGGSFFFAASGWSGPDDRLRSFPGRLRLFSSEDDSLAQVGRVGLLAEGRGGFLSSSAALPFASVAAPICCHRGRVSWRL